MQGPKPLHLAIGTNHFRIADVRHLFPPLEGGAVARPRDPSLLKAIGVHHDAVLMPAGDLDYSGTTLNEDLARLDAIYRHAIAQGWGGFPYHFLATPNGRTFYTTDVHLFGATVARRNHELLGVALSGDLTNALPSPTHLCAAAHALLAIWALTHGRLKPWALLAPWGHRQLALPNHPTACPGHTWANWQTPLLSTTITLARLLEGRP